MFRIRFSRLFSLALALMLLLSLFAGAMAEEAMYVSDFSAGPDGFYPRSMGSATLECAEGALWIHGRSGDWHSPGRDFDLVPGEEYTLSVEVYQDEMDTAEFILSVAHSKNGAESYENLGRAKAKRGEWTPISAKWVAGNFERFVLYVETINAPGLSYAIRAFTVQGRAAEFGAKDIPSLRETYAGLFAFGTALTEKECLSKARMAFCASQFSIVTPGNELKPDFVLDVKKSAELSAEDDSAVAISMERALPMLTFAQENGLKVHGHVLVWHAQTPEAFFHERYDVNRPFVTREVMLSRLDNYIRAVFAETEAAFPGLIVSWDVLNEAIDDGSGKLRASNWLTVVGEDYPERVFEIARKYAPESVKLYYNDYNTAYAGKRAGIIALLKRLMAEGNLDGYGFQMHHSITQPSLQSIGDALTDVSALGLSLRVSELDVTIPAATDENFASQTAFYGNLVRLLIPYAGQLEAVQVWGMTDDQSWRASGFPLLFDRDGQPKDAFFAVIDAVK